MPTVYVDRPFLEVIRKEVEREKRAIRKEQDLSHDADVKVSEKKGLERLLSEEAKRRVEKKRERHGR